MRMTGAHQAFGKEDVDDEKDDGSGSDENLGGNG